MTTTIYVGKLSFDTDEKSLKKLFSEYGNVVEAHIILDRETKKSKGFGFVDMDSAESAQAAITALDGKDFEGQTLIVNLAKPRDEKQPPKTGFANGFQKR